MSSFPFVNPRKNHFKIVLDKSIDVLSNNDLIVSLVKVFHRRPNNDCSGFFFLFSLIIIPLFCRQIISEITENNFPKISGMIDDCDKISMRFFYTI